MRRWWVSLRWEIVLQYRHGFYFVSLAMIGILFLLGWPAMRHLKLQASVILPGFLFVGVLITTFYFVAGLVLLEKTEGSLFGLIVTPLRSHEYLGVKATTLSGLAILETSFLAVLVFGDLGRWGLLLLGLLFLCVTLVWLGFMVIVRYDSFNAYLLPSIVWVTFLILPLLSLFPDLQHPLWWLHPLKPPLALMQAAYLPTLGASSFLAFVLSLGWAAGAWEGSRRAFVRFVEKGEERKALA